MNVEGLKSNMNVEELKAKKKKLGLTNRQIAGMSGVPLGTVQKIFSGETKSPRYDTLAAIENAIIDTMVRDIPDEQLVVRDSSAAAIQTGSAQSVGYDPKWYGKEVSYRVQIIEPNKKQGEYTIEDYYNMPEDWRGELIDGVIYDMTSPYLVHQHIGGYIYSEMLQYVFANGGNCMPMIAPTDVQLDCDDRTMVVPDVIVVCERDKLIKRCVYGAPDFVAEVLSRSTRRKDMTIKLEKYMKAGVKEYWIIDPEKEYVTVYEAESEVFATIYTFKDEIPVGIWNGDLTIDFKKIAEHVAFLKE